VWYKYIPEFHNCELGSRCACTCRHTTAPFSHCTAHFGTRQSCLSTSQWRIQGEGRGASDRRHELTTLPRLPAYTPSTHGVSARRLRAPRTSMPSTSQPRCLEPSSLQASPPAVPSGSAPVSSVALLVTRYAYTVVRNWGVEWAKLEFSCKPTCKRVLIIMLICKLFSIL